MTLNGTSSGGTLSTSSGDISVWLGSITVSAPSSIKATTAGGSLTLANSITGASQLEKTGAGALILSADDSSFSGGFLVSNGSLVANHVNALGSGSISVAGGVLSSSVAAANIGGSLSLSLGGIILNAGAPSTFSMAAGQSFTMSGGTLDLTFAAGETGFIASAGGASDVLHHQRHARFGRQRLGL